MDFEKYMHVEKLISDEVEGLTDGPVLVFPKLDGTNASAWASDGVIKTGSRNRLLSAAADNAGFDEYIQTNEKLKQPLADYPYWRL